MASTNLTYSGTGSGAIKATAYITENTTDGTTRSITLRLAICANDGFSSQRDAKYNITCPEANVNESVDYYSGFYLQGEEIDIFNKTFTVYLNNDNKTANIDLDFDVTFKSTSAPSGKSISGSITTLTLTEYVPEYTLSISAGTGSSVTVNRTSSNYGSTGALNKGAILYNGDKLTITFSALTGYDLLTHSVNGSSFESDDIFTVSGGGVSVVTTAAVKSFLLTVSEDIGTTVTVNRTKSPLQGAKTGQFTDPDGETIYYNDVLVVSVTSGAEYEILTQTINGMSFESGDSHTVTENVDIIVTTKMSGIVYIYDGSEYIKYLIYIYDGSEFVQYIPYVYDGTEWIICS